MTIQTLKLCEIRLDGDTQPRATINQDVVGEYAEAMTEGPPSARGRHEADETDDMEYRDGMWRNLVAVREYVTARSASGDAQATELDTQLDALMHDFVAKDGALAFVAGELEPFESEREWVRPDVGWLCLSVRLRKALVGVEL